MIDAADVTPRNQHVTRLLIRRTWRQAKKAYGPGYLWGLFLAVCVSALILWACSLTLWVRGL